MIQKSQHFAVHQVHKMTFRIQFSRLLCVLLIFSISSLSFSLINPKVSIEVAKYGWKAIQALITIDSSIEYHKLQQNVVNALDKIRQSTARIEYLITAEANRTIDELKAAFDMQIVDEFVCAVLEINERFEKKFMRYFTGNDIYQPETIEEYIRTTINSSDFRKTIVKIQEYTIPNHDIPNGNEKLVFEILHDYIYLKKTYIYDCNESESPHDLIFGVFNLAITALSKGYGMMAHAYRYQQLKSKDPNIWNPKIRDIIDDYKDVIYKIARIGRSYAEMESKVIRCCDPEVFKEGENYGSYEFLTTVISNDYMIDNKNDIESYLNSFSQRSASFCDGFRYNKKYISYNIEAYLPPVNSKRRYCYAKIKGSDSKWYNKGRITDDCDNDYGLYYGNYWNGKKFSTYICEESKSEKKAYFNMSSQYSDTPYTNRVITGIRLVTKLLITYFEIQQGVLVNGTIDNTTVKWDDRVTLMLDTLEKKHQKPNYLSSDLVPLNYDNRSVNLDDIHLPAGWAAVDVKFHKTEGGPINIQVAGVEIFDYLGNPVDSHDVLWFYPISGNRTEITKGNLDIPILGKGKNRELSEPGKHYATFQMTDWSTDASQTLIPFIDRQEVVTDPSVPISGIGIYYKGQDGYGGFIAPKLLSMNNIIYMSENYLKNTFNDINHLSNYDRYYYYSVIPYSEEFSVNASDITDIEFFESYV